jgi:hypothetical protein
MAQAQLAYAQAFQVSFTLAYRAQNLVGNVGAVWDT